MKKILLICILPALVCGCQLHEDPELTAEGEMGVDPTQVTVTADVMLSMKIPKAEISRVEAGTKVGEEADYRHRFIIEAYLDNQSVIREVYYEDLTDRTTLQLPVQLKMHARNYHLVVWSDYVSAQSEDDLFYNAELLDPLTTTSPCRGNTEFKDAYYYSAPLDLTGYRDQWNTNVPVKMKLTRPVARYELIATDMAAFRARMEEAGMADEKFTIRLKYNTYRYMGFDLLTAQPKHLLMYMQYTKDFTLTEAVADEFTVAMDYVFVKQHEQEDIPVMVEIVNAKSEVVARSVLDIPCHVGKSTVIRSTFFSNDHDESGGGIGINPDYDGEEDFEVKVY